MDLKQRVDAVVDSAANGNRIVGAVVLVARNGELVYSRSAGWFDREAGVPMPIDPVFRLASVTKPIVAATALAMVERGLLGLDNAVSDHLPYFRPRTADGREARITIRHLLTHTAGFTYGYKNDPELNSTLVDTDLGLEDLLKRLAMQPLLFEPGTAWNYGMSTDVLGGVIAAIHGGTLDDAIQHYVCSPLKMTDTGFTARDPSRLAVPYADGPPGLRRMADPETVVRPDGSSTTFSPSRIFNTKGWQSGSGGAVGSPGDILTLLETLRMGGGPILRPETVEMAISNQIGAMPRRPHDSGQGFGFIGAVLVDPAAARSPQAPGSFRWGGVYGHDWSVDPTNGFTILAMTNTPIEGCDGAFPKQVRNAVYDWQP